MKSSGGQFRYYVWDAPLILIQIAALQAIFYFTVVLLASLVAKAINGRVSLDLVLDFHELETWQLYPVFAINAAVMYVPVPSFLPLNLRSLSVARAGLWRYGSLWGAPNRYSRHTQYKPKCTHPHMPVCQCLDFACTAHVLHVCACWYYGGFPWSAGWWVLNGICVAISTVTSEYICLHANMDAIEIAGTKLGAK